jgi:hypothetical protein
LAPQANPLDLLSVAWQPAKLLDFNPFLSDGACKRLHEAVLVWLQLCVLEDRLKRLEKLVQEVQAGKEAYMQPLVKVGEPAG